MADKKTFTVYLVDGEPNPIPPPDGVVPVVTFSSETLHRAYYILHSALEAVGFMNCSHPPLVDPGVPEEVEEEDEDEDDEPTEEDIEAVIEVLGRLFGRNLRRN